MLATKNPARALTIFLAGACVVLLAGCTPAGPGALLDGDAALAKGDTARAVEKLKLATELVPGEPRAWNLLGIAYHRSGQPQLAAQAYRQALARDRSNLVSSAHFNLGCLLLEQGDAIAAADEFRSHTMLTNTAAAQAKLGTALLRMRQYDTAERALQTALRLQPNDPEAHNNLGTLNVLRGRARDAVPHFQAALKQNPQFAPALLNSAVLAHQSATTRQAALQYYRQYLAITPKAAHWDAVDGIARQLDLELNPPRTAVSPHLPQTGIQPRTNPPVATVTNPVPPAATSAVVRVPAPATNIARPTLAPAPTTNSATSGIVAVRLPPINPPAQPPTNRPTAPVVVVPPPVQVVILAPPAVAIAPTTRPPAVVAPPTITNLPAAAQNTVPMATTNPVPKAEKPGFFTRLNPFRSKPEKPSVIETGRVFAANPAATGAVAAVPAVTKVVYPHYTYRRPLPPAPGRRADAENAYSKGVAAQRVKATNEAILSYQLAVSADPSYFEPHHNYALLLQATQPKDALAVWETALSIRPDSVESRYNFALALKQAGFPHEAAEEMEKVLTARPQDVQTHLTLGNLYAQQLSDVRRAKPHYLKVIELDPKNPQASAIRYWLTANP